jgi:hypothetical protein
VATEDLIARSRKRYEQLDRLMEEARLHNDEYQQLKQFLYQVDQVAKLFEPKPEPAPEPVPLSGAVATKIPKPPLKNAHGTVMTADLAEYVIRVHGPSLHINKIIEFMRGEGWEGSGDPRRDYKSVIQNLKDKTKRFRNIGKNVWELVGGKE